MYSIAQSFGASDWLPRLIGDCCCWSRFATILRWQYLIGRDMLLARVTGRCLNNRDDARTWKYLLQEYYNELK